MKPKLIILEGADGCGKTTQTNLIAQKLDAKIISQPSRDNLVGFIRDVAKKDLTLNAFERQLLIAISHTVDSFTKFDGESNIVMDRSFISGVVYGKMTGVPTPKMMMINQILSSIYLNAASGKYDTKIFFIVRPERLDNPDKDVFESSIKWEDLNKEYEDLYNKSETFKTPFFSMNEKRFIIRSSGSIQDTLKEIWTYVEN